MTDQTASRESSRVLRKLSTLATAGPRRQALAAEAAARLLVARVGVLALGFPRIAKGLGQLVPADDPRIPAVTVRAVGPNADLARDIGWAVQAVAPYAPFRSVCLQQALAARAMLKSRGVSSAMHFGAGKSRDGKLEAHAWLDAAGVRVTGYPLAPNLSEVGCFL